MTTVRWSARRTVAALVALVALGVGSCGSDDADVAETGAAPQTTEAVAGEVTPVVVCVDDQRGAAYFGYSNSGSAPVEIEVGEANRITGGDGTELTTAQPAVFAPGEQGVVAWADAFAGPVMWSITGADGTEHAATADDTSPPCPEGGPVLDPPDDREITVSAEVEVADGVATIAISVEGLGDESRCPSGTYAWTPAPPEVSVEALGANATAVVTDDPSTAELEVDDVDAEPAEGFDVEGFVSLSVAVDVDDTCTDEAGVASRAWGASESMRDLSQVGTRICFGAVDDGYEEVDCILGPGLGQTGGIRSR